MSRAAISLFALLAAGLGGAPSARAWGDDPVAVAAGADRDYVLRKFGGHGARAESFVFAQGTYFGGYLRDASLERAQFMEIARDLAPDLAVQKYYPAPQAKDADLLIVLHWGMTYVLEDAGHGQTDFEQLQKDGAASDATFSNRSRGSANTDLAASDLDIAYGQSAASGAGPWDNAQLLGYSAELQKEEYRSLGVASGETEMDRVLREDLVDERYFVILMAYDFRTVKGARKGDKPKLLWSTHFSMRATGRSFTDALPAMGKVAANYFGHQVDGLLLDARRVPEGRVDVGTPTTVDDKKPK